MKGRRSTASHTLPFRHPERRGVKTMVTCIPLHVPACGAETVVRAGKERVAWPVIRYSADTVAGEREESVVGKEIECVTGVGAGDVC